MSKKEKRRKPRHDPSGEGGGGSGGVMRSMRGGFKGMVGQGSRGQARTPARKAWDVLFWILILALLGLFAYRRFR
jgi:hypothetical protein